MSYFYSILTACDLLSARTWWCDTCILSWWFSLSASFYTEWDIQSNEFVHSGGLFQINICLDRKTVSQSERLGPSRKSTLGAVYSLVRKKSTRIQISRVGWSFTLWVTAYSPRPVNIARFSPNWTNTAF